MSSYFNAIQPVTFAGQSSKNPFAFKWYDKNKMVLGKTMQEQLRFAVCYWHSFSWNGFDPFGYDGTFERPWQQAGLAPMAAARAKADAAFEFFSKKVRRSLASRLRICNAPFERFEMHVFAEYGRQPHSQF